MEPEKQPGPELPDWLKVTVVVITIIVIIFVLKIFLRRLPIIP